MHRPAFIARFVGLIFLVAIGGIVFSSRTAITNSIVAVNNFNALNANDSVPWSQLGGDGTSLSSTFNLNSLGSISIVGTLIASGSLTSVVCPATPCSWGSPGSEGFGAADTVLWTSDTGNGGTGPLSLSFGTSVRGVGAMIQADGPAVFTAQIQVFNGTSSLGSFTTTSDANGDAVFLGAFDNTADITSAVYSLTACTGACSDFAVDTIFLNTTAAEPTGVQATPTITPGPPTTMAGTPAQIKFGNVDVNTSSRADKVTVTNKGAATATIGEVSLPTGFTIESGTDHCSGQTIAPKKNCTLSVQFSPSSPGPVVSSLSVPYNGGSVLIGVSGNGTTP